MIRFMLLVVLYSYNIKKGRGGEMVGETGRGRQWGRAKLGLDIQLGKLMSEIRGKVVSRVVVMDKSEITGRCSRSPHQTG